MIHSQIRSKASLSPYQPLTRSTWHPIKHISLRKLLWERFCSLGMFIVLLKPQLMQKIWPISEVSSQTGSAQVVTFYGISGVPDMFFATNRSCSAIGRLVWRAIQTSWTLSEFSLDINENPCTSFVTIEVKPKYWNFLPNTFSSKYRFRYLAPLILFVKLVTLTERWKGHSVL